MPKHFICERCGYVAKKKEQVLVSRHTGKAYCRDEVACGRRQYKTKGRKL